MFAIENKMRMSLVLQKNKFHLKFLSDNDGPPYLSPVEEINKGKNPAVLREMRVFELSMHEIKCLRRCKQQEYDVVKKRNLLPNTCFFIRNHFIRNLDVECQNI